VFEHQKPERTERHLALEKCIEKLPQKSRHTLDLRYAEGLSIAEIARRLHSTEGSMRVILCRLRDVLAGCIGQQLRKEAQG
jgi:RNA polymerase sigma-70 factor (ECF subfamily)